MLSWFFGNNKTDMHISVQIELVSMSSLVTSSLYGCQLSRSSAGYFANFRYVDEWWVKLMAFFSEMKCGWRNDCCRVTMAKWLLSSDDYHSTKVTSSLDSSHDSAMVTLHSSLASSIMDREMTRVVILRLNYCRVPKGLLSRNDYCRVRKWLLLSYHWCLTRRVTRDDWRAH